MILRRNEINKYLGSITWHKNIKTLVHFHLHNQSINQSNRLSLSPLSLYKPFSLFSFSFSGNGSFRLGAKGNPTRHVVGMRGAAGGRAMAVPTSDDLDDSSRSNGDAGSGSGGGGSGSGGGMMGYDVEDVEEDTASRWENGREEEGWRVGWGVVWWGTKLTINWNGIKSVVSLMCRGRRSFIIRQPPTDGIIYCVWCLIFGTFEGTGLRSPKCCLFGEGGGRGLWLVDGIIGCQKNWLFKCRLFVLPLSLLGLRGTHETMKSRTEVVCGHTPNRPRL